VSPAAAALAAALAGCAPHATMVDGLARSGYAIDAQGIVAGGELLIEIFVDETGNWVAVLSRASDELACIKAAGSDWMARPSGRPA